MSFFWQTMRIRKTIGRAVLAALFVYIFWLGWQIVRFKRYEQPSPSVPSASLGPFPTEIEGAYHIHSRNSDGSKTVDQIVKIAANARLDFIILTDHGKPNFATLDAQGKKEGVLVLAGTEISSNRGHLLGLGFERPRDSTFFSSEAELAAREIGALGGFSVIAHPYSKVPWSWGDLFEYDGLEIVDADSMLKSHVLRTLVYFPALLVKPTFALLKLIKPPERALRKWDRLLARHFLSGYFSADAHFLYSAIFPVFHLHVLLEKPLAADFGEARRQVFDALRRGHFFSAVDAAAAARGFRFWLEGAALRIAAPFPFSHETVIIRDGQVIRRTGENDLTLPLPGPGAYRVEVYLRERTPLDPRAPWILSNPIDYERNNR